MKNLFLTALVLTISLMACGGGGGDDSSSVASGAESCNIIGLNPKIINGTSCANPAASSVVRVLKLNSQGAITGLCSGTLVTPTKVLTAAHCFLEEGFYQVVSGDTDFSEVANAAGVSIAPGFRLGGPQTSNRLFNDAAILFLDRPLSSPIMPILFSRSPVVGEAGFVFGFGVTETGETSLGSLQGGAMSVAEVTANHLFVAFDGSGVNVCNGDSGGPMIVEVDGSPALAGVVSQGNVDRCQSGDVTTFTNLQSDEVLTWLAGTAGEAFIR